tara:strand:- start:522 stop:926 length:405 start_codon:yes stop_codon:yes gene_type:complete
MAAGNYNFTIEQGTTFKRTFKYKDSEGNSIDLSFHDVSMDIRPSIDSSTTILDVKELTSTKEDGSTTSDTFFKVTSASLGANANEINLTIDADTTASMSFDTAVYDIEISDNQTPKVVTRILQGKIKLSKEVTR